ncbi:MAG: hypothetical protein IJY62_05605 [Clostridia bacterium]|nr:hypothetical protein [Clostridia bacterium]
MALSSVFALSACADPEPKETHHQLAYNTRYIFKGDTFISETYLENELPNFGKAE